MRRIYKDSIIGYKKVRSPGRAAHDAKHGYARGARYIAKLEIPPYAKVRWQDEFGIGHIDPAKEVDLSRVHGKLRASQATVLEIQHEKQALGKPGARVGIAGWDSQFAYVECATVRPAREFNENASEDCGSGLHFYLTRREAAAWGGC